MAQQPAMTVERSAADHLPVRHITTDDVLDALRSGVDDFRAKPSHLVILTVIYPVLALFLSRLVFGYDILQLFFPLAAGFALLGPLAAIGLYELSRRRERGETPTWGHAIGVLRSPSISSILALGGILVVIFLAWIGVAMAIYAFTLGAAPTSAGDFLNRLISTPEGWALILLGNGIGFLFALLVLAISAVSFPLLVDRQVDWVVAMRTSIAAFMANFRPMLAWGLIVAGGLLLGSIPLFVGLALVMPILGHATWHLYRKTVEP